MLDVTQQIEQWVKDFNHPAWYVKTVAVTALARLVAETGNLQALAALEMATNLYWHDQYVGQSATTKLCAMVAPSWFIDRKGLTKCFRLSPNVSAEIAPKIIVVLRACLNNKNVNIRSKAHMALTRLETYNHK